MQVLESEREIVKPLLCVTHSRFLSVSRADASGSCEGGADVLPFKYLLCVYVDSTVSLLDRALMKTAAGRAARVIPLKGGSLFFTRIKGRVSGCVCLCVVCLADIISVIFFRCVCIFFFLFVAVMYGSLIVQ